MIYGELTSPHLGRVAPETVAVLPIAALEQHGDHLPVHTDTAIATELGRRLETALPEKVVLLPTLWVGSSHHHLAFPGTVSISSETYVRVLCDLLESLLSTGFQRVFLLNGHGGNQTPFAEALYRMGILRRDVWIAAQSYWKLAEAELATCGFMETPVLSHACEYETSMMLALRKDLVRMKHAAGSRAARGSEFYDPLGYGACRVSVAETFERLSPNGALGSPELGTAEKGSKLLDLISNVLVSFVTEFADWPLPGKGRPS